MTNLFCTLWINMLAWCLTISYVFLRVTALQRRKPLVWSLVSLLQFSSTFLTSIWYTYFLCGSTNFQLIDLLFIVQHGCSMPAKKPNTMKMKQRTQDWRREQRTWVWMKTFIVEEELLWVLFKIFSTQIMVINARLYQCIIYHKESVQT